VNDEFDIVDSFFYPSSGGGSNFNKIEESLMNNKLNPANVFTGSLVLVSLTYLLLAFRMEVGSITNPGSGFVPLLSGITALFASLILSIRRLRSNDEKTESITKDGLRRFLGYLITVILFIPLFRILGTVISIFGMVLALTKISGSKGWFLPIIMAVSCSALTYVIFNLILTVPLPKGIF
jgi:putative tricarboxylic transport membrane protein